MSGCHGGGSSLTQILCLNIDSTDTCEKSDDASSAKTSSDLNVKCICSFNVQPRLRECGKFLHLGNCRDAEKSVNATRDKFDFIE